MNNNGCLYRNLDHLVLTLSCLFIFILPWRRAIDIDFITVARLIGIILFALWLVKKLAGAETRVPHQIHFVSFSLVIWAIVSISWTPNVAISNGVGRILGVFMGFGMIYVFWDTLTTKRRIILALQSYVFGASVLYFGLLYNFIFSTPDVGGTRYTSLGIQHLNSVSTLLAIGVPICLFLLYNDRNIIKKLTVFNFAYLPGSVFGIMLTGSRQGFVLLLPSLLYIIVISFTQLSKKQLIKILIIMVVPITILFNRLSINYDRLGSTVDSILSLDFGNRFIRWETAFEAFLLNPIVGSGIGSRSEQIQYVAQNSPHLVSGTPHNSYLYILVELGLVGLFLYTFLFFIATKESFRGGDTVFCIVLLSTTILMLVPDDISTDPIIWYSLIIPVLISNAESSLE